MSRGAGFDRCDLDTAIMSDPKFKKLARTHPDLIAVAIAGYVGIVAECWRAAERLAAEDAWPAIVPWSPDAVAAMKDADLLDADGRIVEHAWESWFGDANRRRQAGRARYARYNANRPHPPEETPPENEIPPAPPKEEQSVSQSVARVVVPTWLPRGKRTRDMETSNVENDTEEGSEAIEPIETTPPQRPDLERRQPVRPLGTTKPTEELMPF